MIIIIKFDLIIVIQYKIARELETVQISVSSDDKIDENKDKNSDDEISQKNNKEQVTAALNLNSDAINQITITVY